MWTFQVKSALLLTWFFLCGVSNVQCQEDTIAGNTFGSLFEGKCSGSQDRCILGLGYTMHEGIQGDASCSENCALFPAFRPRLTCGACEPTFLGFETTEELKAAVDIYLESPDDEASSVALRYGFPIGNWNVSLITDMTFMFAGASTFNGDISAWDTSRVTIMFGMFSQASSFNGDISAWDTSRVTIMSGMFFVSSFNGDISSWDTSTVTDMDSMFAGASTFNGDISAWDTSRVTDMRSMFVQASAFNGDISSWDTSRVTDMSGMFKSASTFNQNLCPWGSRVPPNADVFDMFTGSGCPNMSDPVLPGGPLCYSCP